MRTSLISAKAMLLWGIVVSSTAARLIAQTLPPPEIRNKGVLAHPRPVPLSHLYWHFLVVEQHMHAKSLELDTQGKNGSVMRGYLQKKLGFTDTEYATIRTSADRLTGEVNDLNVQASKVIASGRSAEGATQLHALALQREADINSEVAYLRQTLPPQRVKLLEAFISQLFSLSNAAKAPSNFPHSTPKAVQP